MNHPLDFRTLRTKKSFVVADDFVRQILELTQLDQGWYYGAGVPVNWSTAMDACKVYYAMKVANWERFEVSPEIYGGAMVSSYHTGAMLEIICYADSTFDVFLETEGNVVDHLLRVDLQAALNFVEGNICSHQNSSYFSARAILVKGNTDTTDWHLRTRLMEAVSQSLTQPASKLEDEPFVVTSPNIILREYPETQLPSGG